MTQVVVSQTMQNYLRTLALQSGHWATLRLFHGAANAAQGRICLDAEVPVLASPPGHLCECNLVMHVSYYQCGDYREEVLHFEGHYDPGEVLEVGPVGWNQLADTQAYQLVDPLVAWRKKRGLLSFIFLEASTGLKPNQQRFPL